MFVHLRHLPRIEAAVSKQTNGEQISEAVQKEMEKQDEALEREADRMKKDAKAEFRAKYGRNAGKE